MIDDALALLSRGSCHLGYDGAMEHEVVGEEEAESEDEKRQAGFSWEEHLGNECWTHAKSGVCREALRALATCKAT